MIFFCRGTLLWRRGSLLVFTAFSAAFILGLLALVVDIGWMYVNYNKLQTSVDASWKAGFDEMTRFQALKLEPLTEEQKIVVKTRIRDVFLANGHSASEAERLVVGFPASPALFDGLEVSASLPLPLFFSRIMNVPISRISHRRGTGLSDRHFSKSRHPSAVLPIGIPHGEMRSIGSNQFSLTAFQASESFFINGMYIFLPFDETGNPRTDAPSMVFRGYTPPRGDISQKPAIQKENRAFIKAMNFGLLKFSSAWKFEHLKKCLFMGYPRPLDFNQRVKLASFTSFAEIREVLHERIVRNPDDRRVIFPIVDIPPEVLEGRGKIGTSPEIIYELDPDKDHCRIVGFAEFEMDGTAAHFASAFTASETASGLRATFLRYITDPREVRDRLK